MTDAGSKASFKLDLIETVNADPVLEGSDLKLIAAYAAVMDWPKREAWLSTSKARAMTGLSERQVSNSRSRLAGDNRAKRAYLSPLRRQGVTTVFMIDNPWLVDGRQHVAILTQDYRERQKDRQAERRQQHRVTATSAETKEALSHSLGACDVSATNAGNIPTYTPQDIALKEGLPIKVSSVPSCNSYQSARDGDDLHQPFPVPADEEAAASMLMEITAGTDFLPAVLGFFRKALITGKLTPAMVEDARRAAA